MHARHEKLFLWLKQRFPYARLYGPYHHDGRHYYQLMWRGTQLQYGLMPWLEATKWAELDAHSYERYRSMKERSGLTDVPGYARPDFSALMLEARDDAESVPVKIDDSAWASGDATGDPGGS
ncbi:MAG: hypothetical protein NVS3B7_20800 [Candidatus Elarobacter sp.]